MLRAVAFRDESPEAQVHGWLQEMDELLAELRSGNHAYSVWRLVEAADFAASVLRPRLAGDEAAAPLVETFLELVWQRRLAIVRNQTMERHLTALVTAVRDCVETPGWPPQPVAIAGEHNVNDDLRAMNGTIHAAIDDHLAHHLMALTALDFEAAGRAWALLIAELHAHADTEDRLVVPCYERLGRHRPGGQPEMFTAEHNGIRRLLGKLEAQQQRLVEQADVRRAMVDGLDRYLMLRHLLEHHTLREQNILYRHLEAEADPETLGRLRAALVEARPWQLLAAAG